MSTLNEREAVLRRALHAAADAIEPGFDGLERIQARLGRPRPLRGRLGRGGLDGRAAARSVPRLQSARDRLASAIRLAWDRFGPTQGRSGSRGIAHARLASAACRARRDCVRSSRRARTSRSTPSRRSSRLARVPRTRRAAAPAMAAAAAGGPGSTSAHNHRPCCARSGRPRRRPARAPSQRVPRHRRSSIGTISPSPSSIAEYVTERQRVAITVAPATARRRTRPRATRPRRAARRARR